MVYSTWVEYTREAGAGLGGGLVHALTQRLQSEQYKGIYRGASKEKQGQTVYKTALEREREKDAGAGVSISHGKL